MVCREVICCSLDRPTLLRSVHLLVRLQFINIKMNSATILEAKSIGGLGGEGGGGLLIPSNIPERIVRGCASFKSLSD